MWPRGLKPSSLRRLVPRPEGRGFYRRTASRHLEVPSSVDRRRGHFCEQSAEFGKDGVVAIGSVKDLAAEDGAHDESGIGEAGEFALHGADAGCDLSGDLAGEEGLVGGSEEERQDLAPGLAEEHVSDGWGGCTQNEYMMGIDR